MKSELEKSIFGLMTLTMTVAMADVAVAATMEQAMAQCREQVTPIVRECVRQKMGGQRGSPEPYIPGCKAQVTGQVRACVAKLIGAAGLQNQPIEAARESAKGTAQSAASRPRVIPPRTIADITAILDQEKPDPARLKKLQTAADAAEPAKSDPVALAHFYFSRAVVRSELGRTREAVADGERAIQLATGRVDQLVLSSFRNTVALQHLANGEPKQALTLYLKMAEDGERSEKGWLFNVYRQLTNVYLTLGDFDRAQSYVRKVEALWQTASSIRGYADHGGSWHGSVEDAKARMFEARGQLENALKSYQSAEALRRGNIEKSGIENGFANGTLARARSKSTLCDRLENLPYVQSRGTLRKCWHPWAISREFLVGAQMPS